MSESSAQRGVANVAQNTANLDPGQVGTVIGNVPFGTLIRSAAMAIVDAQTDLDKNSLRIAEMFSGSMVLRDPVTMLPIDSNGAVPKRSEAGVYYDTNGKPFQPVMVDTRVAFGRNLDGTPVRLSMIELGFVPNFYQFIETLIEIKISVSLTKAMEGSDKTQGNIVDTVDRSSTVTHQSSHSYGGWWGGGSSSYSSSYTQNDIQMTTTPVDAAYAAKYQYSIEASSLVRTKLVPIPPPPILEQRVRQLMDIERRIMDMQMEEAKNKAATDSSSKATTPKS